MKLKVFILGLALFACASAASAQEAMTEDLSVIVEETNDEVDITEEAQPLQLYALAQNVDDNELLNLYYKTNLKTPQQALMDKAQKVRKNGWIIGGTCAAAGIIIGLVLRETSKHYSSSWVSEGQSYHSDDIIYDDLATWLPMGGGVAIGAAVAIGCNLYANSLQKKASAIATYSAPIIEGDIMNMGGSKLTAGVSVMSNQYTHTKGLGMSFKLNF